MVKYGLLKSLSQEMLKQQCRCCRNSGAYEHGVRPDIQITPAANVAQKSPLLQCNALTGLYNVHRFSFQLKESSRKSSPCSENMRSASRASSMIQLCSWSTSLSSCRNTPHTSNLTLLYRTHVCTVQELKHRGCVCACVCTSEDQIYERYASSQFNII